MSRRPKDTASINWNGFTGDKAIFPVCMRSPSVRGSSLTAQLDAAAQRIDKMVIMMCDSLDRHNALGIDNATQYCIDLADTWLETNYSEFKDRFQSVEVLRWEDDIRSHPTFQARLNAVMSLGETEPEYMAMRDAMSNYYLDSKKRRFETDRKRGLATHFDSEAAFNSSKDYLEEEFAGDMVYHELTGGIPNVYWGLYVDDFNIFERLSGDKDLAFPDTLAVKTQRYGRSVTASDLLRKSAFDKKPKVA